MITDALIHAVVSVLTGLFGLVPAWEVSGSFEDSGGALGSAVANVNGVFPIVTVGFCLLAVLSFRVFLVIWDLVVWIYDKFPFKAT